MILGMSFLTFIRLHTIISLIGIFTGFIVIFGMMGGKRLAGWTGVFLLTTVLTTLTGYLFPFHGATPEFNIGVISTVVLIPALIAIYVKHLAGAWRSIYIVTAILAQWLNTFVGVVQLFRKIAFFNALAPTQKEPPFLIAQALVLVFFVVAAIVSIRKFHPEAGGARKAAIA